jgi:NAD(P)-dependent dehydrogenase (short-subunit alcohol dehydrogenase family)
MADSDQTAAADVGVVGLAVMGSNLARNFARHGHTVALYNRTQARTDALMAAHGAEGRFIPGASVEEAGHGVPRCDLRRGRCAGRTGIEQHARPSRPPGRGEPHEASQ